MFDTHCHLNFGAFDSTVESVINRAKRAGVTSMMIPSTNVATSEKAVALANQFGELGVLCAVGIHPHHVFEMASDNTTIQSDLATIESYLQLDIVRAVGEIGLDRHYYRSTKYTDYEINGQFMKSQVSVFQAQIALATTYKKSLILHNREAREEFLTVLTNSWSTAREERTVFHCCEPSKQLLEYARSHNIFIGVDGDVTYYKEKQDFIRAVPLQMLVLETDAPFLSPEPFRSQPRDTRPPNEPANIPLIAQKIAELQSCPVEVVKRQATENARTLFGLTHS